jgi:DHA1 family multidrug resistance protein-like MFS transporter
LRRSPTFDHAATRDARRGLVLLLVGTAVFRLSQNMGITTLSLLARQSAHLGATQVGLLGSLAGLALAAVTLLVSRHIPHTAAAASAVLGMALLAASLLELALASSFALLVAGALALGAAGGIAMPGLLNALVAGAPARRERVIALYTVVLSISLVAGPLLETFVLALSGQEVRVPYLAFAALPAAGAAALALGRPSADRTGARLDPAVPPATATRASSANDMPEKKGPRVKQRKGLLGSADGQDALLAQLLYAVPFAGVSVFGALVARLGYGVSPAEAQLGFTVFFLFSLASRALLAWRTPLAHRRALLWAAAALSAGGLILLGTGSSSAELFAAMALLGVPHGLTYPLALALVADATPLELLPKANATLLGATNLTSVLVPAVLGAIIPAVGYKDMTLVLLGPVVLFAAVRLGLARRRVAPRVPLT